MPNRLFAVLIFTLITLTGCQTNPVTVDYDTQTNFSDFNYYQWQTENSGSSPDFDPLMADRIKKALQDQLPGAGLQPVSGDQKADMLVRYFLARSTKSQSSNSRGSVGVGGASGGGGSMMGLSLSMPLGGGSVSYEAQIIIDFIGAADNKLKWRGSRNLKFGDQPPAELSAMVQQVVADILAKYPPGNEK